MAKVIAYVNEKGGVGKSSVCFNVAWYLATEENKRVLMIDMDGQRANLTFFAGIDKPSNLATIYDVLVDDLDVKKTVLVVEDNLHIIPATADVAGLTPENGSPAKMQRIIKELDPYYDLIFIDVSPSPNGHIHALAVADGIVIPMLPDITSLEANMGIIESIKYVRAKINPKLRVLGIAMNRFTLRARLSSDVADMAEQMAAAMQTKVFKTKIRQAVALSENVGQNIGITSYIKGGAADDFRKLSKEILQEVE